MARRHRGIVIHRHVLEQPMKPLRVSNDLLGDRDKLDERLAEDGYLYFPKGLDPAAVSRTQQELIAVLTEHGLARAGGGGPLWTGEPATGDEYAEIERRGLWQRFAAEPTIQEFFHGLLGEPFTFSGVSAYRFVVPNDDSQLSEMHQDGFWNGGLYFRTCWIPLGPADSVVGGLAVAERQHVHGILHQLELSPVTGCPEIAVDVVPPEAWRRADYHPGDVVIMHPLTPHTGLPNRSADRLRLSIDIRVIPESQHPKLVPSSTSHTGNITIDTIVALQEEGVGPDTARDVWFQLRALALDPADRDALREALADLVPAGG